MLMINDAIMETKQRKCVLSTLQRICRTGAYILIFALKTTAARHLFLIGKQKYFICTIHQSSKNKNDWCSDEL